MSLYPIEPMQLDASLDDPEMGLDNEPSLAINCQPPPSQQSLIVESAPFEVEIYASQYSGYAKLMRLLYIADHCPPLQIDALEQALKYVKESTFNVNQYTNIHHKLVDALTLHGQAHRVEQFPLDTAWLDEKSHMSQVYMEKLDNDLKNYKSNSIKESIRRGHDDLGTHYLLCGDLVNAIKCFTRSRDYCIGDNQVFNVCLNVIKISIYQQNWPHVNSFIQKVESSAECMSDPVAKTKISCAAGLYDLVSRCFKKAAKRFMTANFDYLNQDYSEILSPNNVAIYGGLCALATFTRKELHKNIIANPSFKLFLELEPQLRDAICKFYESKYQQCLSLLEEVKDAFMLDIYLAPHLRSIYSLIRNRALIQYFSPYVSADMRIMANAFNTSLCSLEEELTKLILDGQITARIDSQNKILYAKDSDQRLVTFEKALEMGREFRMKANALILRTACTRNGLIFIRPVSSSSPGSGSKTEEATSALGNLCSPSSPTNKLRT